jgi:uncharacterized protein YutE (UPF0331/DUF86 family)
MISERGLSRPETYRALFPVLAQAGVIDEPTAAELSLWAGLRNVVVHLYWKLHFEQIHDAMTNRLAALRTFARIAAGSMAARP